MGVRKEDGIVPMEERLVATDISRYKLVRSNWFAYNPMRLNIGSIARWQGGRVILVSPDYVVFRCLEQPTAAALHPDYLDHFRRSSQWDAFVNEAGDGGVRVRIYYRDIAQLRLIVPEIAEQQKIADCLGSLDDLIAAESRRLEALRQYKQGLMQQLFPRPGETVPRLRFPEFANAPHWQTSTFGERCESFSGSTPDTSNRGYYGGTIPFIRSAEIGKDKTEIFLTEEGLAHSVAKMVRRGDLLVALYGANSGNAALARIDGAINQAIMCLRSHDSAPYLYHYLTARKNWIITTYLQGGQGNLSGRIVLSVPLSVPHRREQEKVADCLGALDDLIMAEGRKIEVLRQHKQGLMQQMFPSLER